MKIKPTLFLFLFLFIILLPSLPALSLSGNSISPIIFEPGKSITNHYTIVDTPSEVEVLLSGDLLEYVQITPLENNGFDLLINFPDEFISPGTYHLSLTVKEKNPSTSGISSLLSLVKNFVVEVYSHEKEIELSMVSPSVNEGNPVIFQVNIQSRSYSNIDSIRAKIDVYDPENKKLSALNTNEKSLPALASETLTASFPTTNLKPGEYTAQATVFYDGKQKSTNNTFRIGKMDVLIKNYTKQLQQGFSDFSVTVFNNWGHPLRNVYAKLLLSSQELLQTPSLDLEPWQEAQLQGIVKVDFPPGEYQGKIQLFFESESKDVPITITIVEPIAEPNNNYYNLLFFVLGSILAILFIFLIIVLIFKSKKKNLEK